MPVCVPPFSTDVRRAQESTPLSVTTDNPLSPGLSRVQSDSYRVCGLAPNGGMELRKERYSDAAGTGNTVAQRLVSQRQRSSTGGSRSFFSNIRTASLSGAEER